MKIPSKVPEEFSCKYLVLKPSWQRNCLVFDDLYPNIHELKMTAFEI